MYVLKHSEPHQSLQLLYTLAFKLSPPQTLASTKSSTSSNTGHKNEKEDFMIPLMIASFVFGHGDNGGVIIRYQSDDADELENADGILRGLRGDGLSDSEVRALCIVELLSDLKKENVAGDFFIYLMQELTNIISDFSEDIGVGGTVS